MKLTILMPCLNEEEVIKDAILDAKLLIEKLNIDAQNSIRAHIFFELIT